MYTVYCETQIFVKKPEKLKEKLKDPKFKNDKDRGLFSFILQESETEPYISVYYDGLINHMELFDECLKELAPYIKKGEDFYAYVSSENGDEEIMYNFDGKTVHKYHSRTLFPDNGFYPMKPEDVLKAIKSKPELEEFIRQKLN